jgi:hypothetical protein
MVIISINGKKLENKFQNMAQALAFAYQSGNCYGADVVELALDGKSTAKSSGFTQADIEAAVEEANAIIKARDEEITELKAQLAAKGADGEQNPPADAEQNPTQEETPLEEMNKEQLLAYAQKAGIDVKYTASKDEILATIQAALDKANKEVSLDNADKT